MTRAWRPGAALNEAPTARDRSSPEASVSSVMPRARLIMRAGRAPSALLSRSVVYRRSVSRAFLWNTSRGSRRRCPAYSQKITNFYCADPDRNRAGRAGAPHTQKKKEKRKFPEIRLNSPKRRATGVGESIAAERAPSEPASLLGALTKRRYCLVKKVWERRWAGRTECRGKQATSWRGYAIVLGGSQSELKGAKFAKPAPSD